ncbi:DUF397 domain-containing protein [Streptomyces sp. AV19]|uniref:DUF397 domain-containing protein n=1 Tax=Streptomyces sp. AV19 TaxID=2793068 RepID=UPI001F3B2AFC|nr:DUF397 domain-containing protein [Streptomyces sp. AV19]MDG4532454.1 DUF397 domain-containing protein [Streptomyces sp. AV19]
MSNPAWRKSAYSDGGGDCVEMSDEIRDVASIRDAKRPRRRALQFPTPAWTSFTAALAEHRLAAWWSATDGTPKGGTH